MTENRPVTSTSSVLESPLKAGAREADRHAAASHAHAPEAAASRPGKHVDKAQIEALIAREYVGLRLLIIRRAGDVQVAEDLLNDAVCTTWEKWQAGHIERPEQIAGYIFQVAMNLLRNHRRSIAERPEKRADAKALEGLTQAEPAERQGVEERIAAQVKHLLRSMGSERDRTLLVRFYLDEEDRESICRDLGMTPAQFARVIHRARARLRQLLESHGMKGSDLYSLFLVM
jgi:RNA polymerase sigma-70 factor (ECF subfamily)